MKITVIGSGYVGLVSGTCFAHLGNSVVMVDSDEKKIRTLKKGGVPIYESGLKELLKKNRSRMQWTTSIKEGVRHGDIIFIAVPTPPREDGSADLSFVENVASQIAKFMDEYKLVVDKSTVPVETGEWVKTTITRNLSRRIPFDVASNPEFLREGSAVNDFLHPDRVVVGVETKRAEKLLMQLYKPLKAPIVVTDIKSAELIKHASNSFLATKISFINAVACICEKVGADVRLVAKGMGLDKRIGMAFLNAGAGYGGSCFPKDIDAFYWIAKKIGYDFHLLREVKNINEHQKTDIVKKLEDALWILKDKVIGVLGLSFKPNTDDMRLAPSIEIIEALCKKGATIRAYDPQAMQKAKEIMPDITYCKDTYDTLKGCDCLLLMTEWDEFRKIDFSRIKKIMKQLIVIDARNMFEPDKLKKSGFIYKGVGR